MSTASSRAQKLLKISLFLFQSICGALFFTLLALTFSLASAAVGLRLNPLSSNGSLFSESPSCREEQMESADYLIGIVTLAVGTTEQHPSPVHPRLC